MTFVMFHFFAHTLFSCLADSDIRFAHIIGRQFSHAGIASISPLASSELDDALNQLIEAGLLFRGGPPNRVHYVFKHALVQEAAYGSLLKSKRRELHARVAEALADEIAETEPELLAHHYTEAGLDEAALDHWLAAGQRATERAAYLEAIAHLKRGLALIQAMPETRERLRREIAIRVAMGVPLANTESAGSPVVGENYRRARTLCETMGARAELLHIDCAWLPITWRPHYGVLRGILWIAAAGGDRSRALYWSLVLGMAAPGRFGPVSRGKARRHLRLFSKKEVIGPINQRSQYCEHDHPVEDTLGLFAAEQIGEHRFDKSRE